MRKTLLLIMITTGLALFSSTPPAAALDYPWCVQGKGVGYPGDCSYSTRAQCMASASGRNVGCGVNPRVAFGQQRRGRFDRY